ncbi:MAG TPA: acyl-CoA dehydrogenase family protein [Acidimicrobiia bacterium]|nr:acyl-CoA dehydrogenase family protein [Acidimicrobiia bacterium]
MTDPTNLEDTSSPDWESIASKVGADLAAGVAERDRSGAISLSGFKAIVEAGISRALVPREFGGGGVSHAQMGVILRTLGRYDGPTAVTLSMHTHLVAAQVWRHKHGMDAERVLRRVADGVLLISTGASDWVGAGGTARRVEDGYIVSARKSPASGCEVGQVLVTSIRWEESPDGPQVIHCSIPMSSEGVSIERTWDTLGMRASASHTVVLEDVFVPDSSVSLIRPADRWHPVWNTVIGAAMPLIVSAYMGIGDAVLDLALEAAGRREGSQLDSLLGEVVNAHTTAADAVAAMYESAADLTFDNIDEMAALTLSRKTTAAGALIKTGRLAMELIGGSSYGAASNLQMHLRDLLGSQFHPLPRSKQLEFTGRTMRGLSPVG